MKNYLMRLFTKHLGRFLLGDTMLTKNTDFNIVYWTAKEADLLTFSDSQGLLSCMLDKIIDLETKVEALGCYIDLEAEEKLAKTRKSKEVVEFIKRPIGQRKK